MINLSIDEQLAIAKIDYTKQKNKHINFLKEVKNDSKRKRAVGFEELKCLTKLERKTKEQLKTLYSDSFDMIVKISQLRKKLNDIKHDERLNNLRKSA